jgi:hypothetical protein
MVIVGDNLGVCDVYQTVAGIKKPVSLLTFKFFCIYLCCIFCINDQQINDAVRLALLNDVIKIYGRGTTIIM